MNQKSNRKGLLLALVATGPVLLWIVSLLVPHETNKAIALAVDRTVWRHIVETNMASCISPCTFKSYQMTSTAIFFYGCLILMVFGLSTDQRPYGWAYIVENYNRLREPMWRRVGRWIALSIVFGLFLSFITLLIEHEVDRIRGRNIAPELGSFFWAIWLSFLMYYGFAMTRIGRELTLMLFTRRV